MPLRPQLRLTSLVAAATLVCSAPFATAAASGTSYGAVEEGVPERSWFAWWFVGGLLALLVLVAINQLIVRKRRHRIRMLVDAQEQADAAQTGPANGDQSAD